MKRENSEYFVQTLNGKQVVCSRIPRTGERALYHGRYAGVLRSSRQEGAAWDLIEDDGGVHFIYEDGLEHLVVILAECKPKGKANASLFDPTREEHEETLWRRVIEEVVGAVPTGSLGSLLKSLQEKYLIEKRSDT